MRGGLSQPWIQGGKIQKVEKFQDINTEYMKNFTL